jgi:hypothetical protein
MKRDFDLIRRIMVQVEKVPAGHLVDESLIEFLGLDREYDRETILEHIKLILEEGLVRGKVHESFGANDSFNITGITWKGHDFIDASKDETIWGKAKETVLKPTASITFGILLEWLKQEAKAKLGLP